MVPEILDCLDFLEIRLYLEILADLGILADPVIQFDSIPEILDCLDCLVLQLVLDCLDFTLIVGNCDGTIVIYIGIH